MRLNGKVALVSGGANGIGAAICRRFAQQGATVGIADVDTVQGEALVRELIDDGATAIFLPLDVTVAEQWTAAVQKLEQDFACLNVLVNNAGIFARKELVDIEDQDWDQMMAVNAKGPFLGSRAAIPAMRRAAGGSIVNMSSTAGLKGSYAAHYGSSKGAIRQLTKSTAFMYGKHGIRCNSVHPGPVATQMGFVAVPEDVRGERIDKLPLGRFGTPAEIANVVLFLASDESSFMTGSEVVVDGGAMMG